jgi:FkbM family methyltransferase
VRIGVGQVPVYIPPVGIKDRLRMVPRQFGFDVVRYRPDEVRRLGGATTDDADADIRQIIGDVEQPVIVDVGANVGQSITRFRRLLPTCRIHSFEPGPSTFAQLRANTAGLRDVELVQASVGARSGRATLFENEASDMSSLLQPDATAWGAVRRATEVEVVALDDYCGDRGITHVDVLKSDTQGTDLEVLRGAAGLLGRRAITVVSVEVIFSRMYVEQSRADQILALLFDHGYQLVGIYDYLRQGSVAGWCDMVFTPE